MRDAQIEFNTKHQLLTNVLIVVTLLLSVGVYLRSVKVFRHWWWEIWNYVTPMSELTGIDLAWLEVTTLPTPLAAYNGAVLILQPSLLLMWLVGLFLFGITQEWGRAAYKRGSSYRLALLTYAEGATSFVRQVVGGVLRSLTPALIIALGTMLLALLVVEQLLLIKHDVVGHCPTLSCISPSRAPISPTFMVAEGLLLIGFCLLMVMGWWVTSIISGLHAFHDGRASLLRSMVSGALGLLMLLGTLFALLELGDFVYLIMSASRGLVLPAPVGIPILLAAGLFALYSMGHVWRKLNLHSGQGDSETRDAIINGVLAAASAGACLLLARLLLNWFSGTVENVLFISAVPLPLRLRLIVGRFLSALQAPNLQTEFDMIVLAGTAIAAVAFPLFVGLLRARGEQARDAHRLQRIVIGTGAWLLALLPVLHVTISTRLQAAWSLCEREYPCTYPPMLFHYFGIPEGINVSVATLVIFTVLVLNIALTTWFAYRSASWLKHRLGGGVASTLVFIVLLAAAYALVGFGLYQLSSAFMAEPRWEILWLLISAAVIGGLSVIMALASRGEQRRQLSA